MKRYYLIDLGIYDHRNDIRQVVIACLIKYKAHERL